MPPDLDDPLAAVVLIAQALDRVDAASGDLPEPTEGIDLPPGAVA